MPRITDVGAELAEVPFGDFIANVAQGIADGQRALDLTAVQTLLELSKATVDLIPEVTEVITPEQINVNVSGHDPIPVTGARITASASEAVPMSALQAGIVPSFYQFAEATIQLKMSLQMREVEKEETEGADDPRPAPVRLARELPHAEHVHVCGGCVEQRHGGDPAGAAAVEARSVGRDRERTRPAPGRDGQRVARWQRIRPRQSRSSPLRSRG